MKVEKDLREADGVQDERRNGKTGGNSARSFAVLTLCAVLAMVISLGTRTFAESEEAGFMQLQMEERALL